MQSIPEDSKGHAPLYTPPSATATKKGAPPALFASISQWLELELAQETLEKLDGLLQDAGVQCEELIGQKLEQHPQIAIQFKELSQRQRAEIEKNFPQKWQRGEEAAHAFKGLKGAFLAGDAPKAANFLLQLASICSQRLLPAPNSLQALREALGGLLSFRGERHEEDVGDLVVKLAMGRFVSGSLKKWGQDVGKGSPVEELELMAHASPETPFTPNARKLLGLGFSGDTEALEKQLIGLLKEAIDQSRPFFSTPDSVEESASTAQQKLALQGELVHKAALNHLQQALDPAFQEIVDMFLSILNLLDQNAKPPDPAIKALIQRIKNIASGDWTSLIAAGNDIFTLINSLIGKGTTIGTDTIVNVLKLLDSAFNKIYSLMDKGDPALQKPEVKELIKRLAQLGHYLKDLQEIFSFFDAIKKAGGDFSSLSQEQMTKMINAYLDLVKEYPNMDKDMQAVVDGINAAFASTNITFNGQKVSLMDWIAMMLCYDALPDVKTEGHSNQFLDRWLETFAKDKDKNPAFKALLESLRKLQKNDYVIAGLPMFADDGKSFSKSRAFIDKIKQGKMSAADLEQLQKLLQTDLNKINDAIKAVNSQLDVIYAAHRKFMDSIKAIFTDIENKLLFFLTSLPDLFYDLIINKYMGNQEKILQAFAEILYMGNMGGGFFRDLQSILGNDWNSANLNNIFDMGTYMRDHPGATVDDFKKHAAAEINKLKEMVANADKAIAQIDKDMDAIKNDPTFSKDPIKKQAALDALQASKNEITAKRDQIKALIAPGSDLDKIQNAPAGTKLEDIKTWAANVAKVEQLCVDGDSSKVPPIPSINKVYTNLTTAQNNYSGMSTTAQLQLMMTMTSVQQEWSLVSSALQSLNSMYLACARGIHQ